MTRHVLCLLAAATLAPAAFAQQATQVPVGVRGIGMGGAYSALADDVSALFWNPAGLAWISSQELATTHANLFGSDVSDNHLAFALPLSRRHVVAMDWYHSGFDDGELAFGENRFGLGWGHRPVPWLSLGGTAKYLTRSVEGDGALENPGTGTGFDFGALVAPSDNLRFGLVAQDVFDTRLGLDSGDRVVAYARTTRLAASWSPRRWATVAVDVDDRWHLGLEAAPLEAIALRFGLQDDRRGDEGATWAYGVGLATGIFHFDYAYEQHPLLDPTHHLGLALRFNLNPALIHIEKVEPRDLFASLHKSYGEEPVAVAQVRNLQERPVEAQVSVFIPGLMDAPSTRSVLLRPRSVQAVPLHAAISPRVMEQAGDRSAQVQVAASYPSRRLTRTEKATAPLVAYGPGAIDWSAGVAQAAAFVTPRDPIVEQVAREAVRVVAADGAARFGARNVAFAAALFDALRALEIAYVPDPNNPFGAISETRHAVDTIQYPGQTLLRRAGDCDDTTVLLAALLGSVGVNTRIVDAPGHVFLLVDTGVHERNRASLAIADELLVIRDGGIWLPVETTAIPKGFAEAWRIGAESFASWDGRGQIELVDVAAAQARYVPAQPAPGGAAPAIDIARLAGFTAADAGVIAGWSEAWMASRYGSDRDAGAISADALNEVAHAFFSAGRLAEARLRLEQAVAAEPQSPKFKNNLGLVLACEGEGERAIGLFATARQLSPGAACHWFNEGLLRLAAADTLGARVAFAEGVTRMPNHADVERTLGLETGDGGQVAEAAPAADQLRGLLRGPRPNVVGPRPALPAGVRISEPWHTHLCWWD